jgi:DNA polymerase-3 subunit alpha
MNKKIVFFDTETTGLPDRYDLRPQDYEQIPRMVQLAYQVHELDSDSSSLRVAKYDKIIKPEGYEIPVSTSNIHGITTERAMLEGHHLYLVLSNFSRDCQDADLIVCHNVNFDMMILGGEYCRLDLATDFMDIQTIQKYCTMQESKEWFGVWDNDYNDYKFPSLSELHVKLFGKGFANAHDAKNDVQATVDCYVKLLKRGIITV